MTENEILESAALDQRRARRLTLTAKHAKGLTTLMDTRNDLRGVFSLADHLEDAIRWTA